MLPLLVVALSFPACQLGLVQNRGAPVRPDDAAFFNLCGAPEGLRGAGSWDDPVRVTAFPFTDAADSSDAPADAVDTWDCGQLDRSGGEVVYALTLDAASAHIRAELRPDPGVAASLQLIPASSAGGGAVTGCIATSNLVLDAEALEPGDYLLVVDTIVPESGEVREGPFRMSVDVVTDGSWTEVQLADGLLWRRWHDDLSNWNVFVLDLAERDLKPRPHEACASVPDTAAGFGALMAISGGFRDEACQSLDLVRADGVTFSTNAYADTQRVLGWDDGGTADLLWLERGRDYDLHGNAFGAYPSLVAEGLIAVEPGGTDAFWTTPAARTAVGVTPDDELLLFVADGGSRAGAGLRMDELAAAMAELGAIQAVNLDGGAATTAWVEGCSASGIVNFPLDGGGNARDGASAASDGLYVF